MCLLDHFIPHREELPIRHCADCKALLSTGNRTNLCWAHGKAWDVEFRDTQILNLFAKALQDFDAALA